MASHRLSEVYRQNKQASTLGYEPKAKTNRAGTAVKSHNQPDAAAGTHPITCLHIDTQALTGLCLSGLDNQRVLRQFDLSAKFGPCTNLTRKQRYDTGAISRGQVTPCMSCVHATDLEETARVELHAR